RQVAQNGAAERDGVPVDGRVGRLAHQGVRVVEASALFQVVRGAGVRGQAGAQVEHVLYRLGGTGDVAELGTGVGQYAVRVRVVRVDRQCGQRGVPGGREVMPRGGERAQRHQPVGVAVRLQGQRPAGRALPFV